MDRRRFIRQATAAGVGLWMPICDAGGGLDSPYDEKLKYRYKVNLHAHTTERDAGYAYSPKDLLECARGFGFDAFAITDLPNAGGIVDDPGVGGILHIPGIEYGGDPHLIGLGIETLTDSKNKQDQICNIIDQGGIAYIPHPFWGGYDIDTVLRYKNYNGISVFNSLTYGVAKFNNNSGEVISYNEHIIDSLLSEGIEVAIIAEEDTKYEDPHDYGHQLNTAWVTVWSDESPENVGVRGIIDAIKCRRFTSHARHLREGPCPPEFVDIYTDDAMIGVELDKRCNIEFITRGGMIKEVVGYSHTGSYRMSKDDMYVRVKATYNRGGSSWAWSNAIFIR